jgi:hypothetical protein
MTKSIVMKAFGRIDHLPDGLTALMKKTQGGKE